MIDVETARNVVVEMRKLMSNALRCVSKPEPDWEEYQYELWRVETFCHKVREIVNE